MVIYTHASTCTQTAYKTYRHFILVPSSAHDMQTKYAYASALKVNVNNSCEEHTCCRYVIKCQQKIKVFKVISYYTIELCSDVYKINRIVSRAFVRT